LTRGQSGATALDILKAIIESSPPRLKGSSGYIKGSYNCVCFMEAPLSEVANMLKFNASLQKADLRPRYEAYGIAVPKRWLWQRGGRPVIYQPLSDYGYLADKIKFKHVTFDPPDIDFTWEREWRINTNFLQLDPQYTTVIVRTQDDYYSLQQLHFDTMRQYVYHYGEDAESVVKPYPWKVISLDSL
jgi:hypothetical protein